jgi:hypothetical protein
VHTLRRYYEPCVAAPDGEGLKQVTLARSSHMLFRSIRPQACVIFAALALATISTASAKGVTLVQQADGSVKTYVDVNIRMVGQTLWIQTADKKGVLKIVNGACSFTRAIERCLPYAVTLIQDGKSRQIAILHGTVFLNLTNTAQRMSLSSDELAPRTILALWHTVRGTYVTIKGKLDEVGR